MKKTALNILFALLIPFTAGCSSLPLWTAGEVPFVPTPPEVVDRMLELAQIKSSDVVYDLGSGDGRIIIEAAKRYGIRGVGIEIDPDLVAKARNNAFREQVEHLVEFRAQDALTVNVSEATVVTLYMLPEFNAKLRPTFDRQLRSGARVVSHDFEIAGWTPVRTEHIKGDILHDHTIYLFQVKPNSQ